jgi:hypothetical protein
MLTWWAQVTHAYIGPPQARSPDCLQAHSWNLIHCPKRQSPMHEIRYCRSHSQSHAHLYWLRSRAEHAVKTTRHAWSRDLPLRRHTHVIVLVHLSERFTRAPLPSSTWVEKCACIVWCVTMKRLQRERWYIVVAIHRAAATCKTARDVFSGSSVVGSVLIPYATGLQNTYRCELSSSHFP